MGVGDKKKEGSTANETAPVLTLRETHAPSDKRTQGIKSTANPKMSLPPCEGEEMVLEGYMQGREGCYESHRFLGRVKVGSDSRNQSALLRQQGPGKGLSELLRDLSCAGTGLRNNPKQKGQPQQESSSPPSTAHPPCGLSA